MSENDGGSEPVTKECSKYIWKCHNEIPCANKNTLKIKVNHLKYKKKSPYFLRLPFHCIQDLFCVCFGFWIFLFLILKFSS
jgi:hypothetical protein